MTRRKPTTSAARPVTPANFGRDTRRISTLTSVGAFGLAFAASATALTLAFAATGSDLQTSQTQTRIARLDTAIATARAAAGDAPEATVFASLRERITALNALDYGATPSPNGLLDALEETLPDDTILTNIDYDRNKRAADLVATSANSQALTRLFDVLNGHAVFTKVRLLDKKQVAAAGNAHTQVHMLLDVGEPQGRAKAGTP